MPPKPAPADFAESCKTMSQSALGRHYAASQRTIKRWIDETGFVALRINQDHRPMPDDFRENVHLGQVELCKKYKCGTQTLARWLEAVGYVANYSTMPDDFKERAQGLTIMQAAKIFNAHRQTVTRWFKCIGLEPARPARIVSEPPVKRTPATISNMGRAYPASRVIDRPHGPQDAARDVLRAERWPVYRCTETGRADPDGKFWRVGLVVCDGDELLARAAKYVRAAA
jgi:hypothetical protein